MVGAANAVLWTVVTFSFVLFVLGFLVYALVRPFTHRDHEHHPVRWQGHWDLP